VPAIFEFSSGNIQRLTPASSVWRTASCDPRRLEDAKHDGGPPVSCEGPASRAAVAVFLCSFISNAFTCCASTAARAADREGSGRSRRRDARRALNDYGNGAREPRRLQGVTSARNASGELEPVIEVVSAIDPPMDRTTWVRSPSPPPACGAVVVGARSRRMRDTSWIRSARTSRAGCEGPSPPCPLRQGGGVELDRQVFGDLCRRHPRAVR